MGMVFGEERYKENMQTVVLPYIKERETESFVERTPGEKLHLVTYHADQAKGSIVISHGFTESTVKFAEVIYYFLNAGYHVYMADHCGHGKSYRLVKDDMSLVHVDSYKRYVDDLLYIAHLCKKAYPDLPMYIYAHSMGGGVAAVAIAAEPKLFTKAVLTSPMIRPQTGNIPWTGTKLISLFMTLTGRDKNYVMGQKPYDGSMTFKDSCGSSEARFDYYKEIQDENEYLQTCACSYAWIREAVKMNTYLRNTGWKKVEIPVLLMQAKEELLVSNQEQALYIQKIASNGKSEAILQEVMNTRHEIYNATAQVQEGYWEKIFTFLNK